LVREHQPILSVVEGKALDLPELEAAVKSLLLTDDKHTTFYLIILPISKELNLKVLRNLLVNKIIKFFHKGLPPHERAHCAISAIAYTISKNS
jgi:hypothetical protein